MAEQHLFRFSDLAIALFGKTTIQTIVEIGARDCTETLEFNSLFPRSKIFTFECNTMTLPLCRKAVKGRDKIKLIEEAVSDKKGTVSFYPINTEKTETTWEDGNPGASSLFKASGQYPVEKYVQDKITVRSTTLKDFMNKESIKTIDMLWMDIQGAELLALKGASDRISDIRLLHLEVEFMEIYSGQALYSDLKSFLNRKGFLLIGFTNFGEYSADAVFINARKTKIRFLPGFIFKDRLLYHWKMNRPKYVRIWSKTKSALKFPFALLSKMLRFGSTIILRPVTALNSLVTTFNVPNKPVLTLRRSLYYIGLRRIKPLLRLDPNLNDDVHSNLALDVVIPTTEKDIPVLIKCVAGLRTNLRHPIGTIFLVAPPSNKIKKIAEELKCKFINEQSILPIEKNKIKYRPRGIDRAGWICQQFVKYSGDKIAKHENYLVIDSDTILTRPQIFMVNNRPIFNHSDEYHLPYYNVYRKLVSEKASYPLSFTSHHMIFNKKVLSELKTSIEDLHNKPWHEAILANIDKKELSAISDYETYGNYYSSHYPAIHLYWFNRLIDVNRLDEYDELISTFGTSSKSFSFHTHEKL